MSFASNGVANPKVASQAGEAGEIASQSDDKMINVVRGNNVRAYLTVVVLFIINLLNYMDRQTVAGLLDGIQSYFDIQDNNSAAGLLQTVFICSYMVLAPVFGYLGDRYRRKYLMAAGILVWSGTVFASTMLSKDSLVWPSVLAMLSFILNIWHYILSGLGYIVGTEVAALFGHQWQWGLRVTPIIGAVCVFLCIFVVHEPKRGAIERGENPHGVSASDVHNTTSWWADLKYLATVKSFIWLNLGFTCVSFVTGALAFWAPKFLLYATRAQGISETESEVSLKVGIITCVAGIVGVWLGAEIAWRYRTRNRKADALVCAVALIGSAPFLYGCLVLASTNIKVTYALIFFGEVLLFMNWAPVGDMVLYIIIPSRRSTAEAAQILVSHLFGDAGSPWLVGEISDRIRGAGSSDKDRAQSMEYSLLMSTFISVIGGFCFIMCSIYLVDDREKAEQVTRNEDEDTNSLLNTVPSDDFLQAGHENGAVDNCSDYDDDNDDDELLDDEPISPAMSEREALVVPVDVHGTPPTAEEEHNFKVV
ncbi:hypothetical protein pdam_00008114 [Pocillopora damicornis]|uniref:Major facilitator superfamily (MFS) profile domain-containing protein n=1 Tax=Pocillopora damicornis TaxID=46731 RepID=A0A3M6UDW1_POCDA|nr:hypothetical protein pdam_00008114 [Pocillopora damicornis]